MAWIKTIPFTEANEALLKALEGQHSLLLPSSPGVRAYSFG